jgi:diadenosine tetraphosphatase ApaH/serine/threonine PP2A family protein phosphatase
MGNHEFNAIAYATPRRDVPSFHYRPRHGDNVRHHQSFLDAADGADSARHRDWIGFFRSLPLWYGDNGMRAVHACWSQAALDGVAPYVDHRHVLTEEGLHAVNIRGSEAYLHAEVLLKGIETDLPPGVDFRDANGSPRVVAIASNGGIARLDI